MLHLLALALAPTLPRLPIGRITSLDRSRLDTSQDADFYRAPKLITHADDAFLAALTALYGEMLPPGARVLDLMSSHVSHLPDGLEPALVDTHGMNAAELEINPARASTGGRVLVHDLNADPTLPFCESASYDAVLCCLGVQYLTEAEQTFAEAARVLKPGSGQLIVSFADKFFYPKALSGWKERGMATRAKLVKDYMRASGGFADIEIVGEGTGLAAQLLSLTVFGCDPFCAVVGRRDESS
eukprot:1469563-Prymnesium_polylepis.1